MSIWDLLAGIVLIAFVFFFPFGASYGRRPLLTTLFGPTKEPDTATTEDHRDT